MVAGQTQGGEVLGSVADGVCLTDQPRCAYPEDLFIDNIVLKQVSTLAEVGPGRWYFDYGKDQIYTGDDPTGRLVETSVAPVAFAGFATGVAVRAMIIEKFASPTHEAALNDRGPGWNCEIRWNHFAGIRTVDHAVARGNFVHHNGAFGFIGAGRNILVESNEIPYNNTRGYNPIGQRVAVNGCTRTGSWSVPISHITITAPGCGLTSTTSTSSTRATELKTMI